MSSQGFATMLLPQIHYVTIVPCEMELPIGTWTTSSAPSTCIFLFSTKPSSNLDTVLSVHSLATGDFFLQHMMTRIGRSLCVSCTQCWRWGHFTRTTGRIAHCGHLGISQKPKTCLVGFWRPLISNWFKLRCFWFVIVSHEPHLGFLTDETLMNRVHMPNMPSNRVVSNIVPSKYQSVTLLD